MTQSNESWGPETFDRIYADDPDPWRFNSSSYEREKYTRTLAMLQHRHFGDALEVGCSIGVFTRLLSQHCDRLLAVDVAEVALAAARQNCVGRPWVRIERRQIPADWPTGLFNLIVLSEVLYFLGSADIVRSARCTAASLRPAGLALLVNWTGPTDTPCTGNEAAELFERAAAPDLRALRRVRRGTYRLDLLASADASEWPDTSI